MYTTSLDDIGFYTLSDDRARNCSKYSPLWRCELILTTACNFKCPYCRSLEPKGQVSTMEAYRAIKLWANMGLKNIRFSGGEPTMWKGSFELELKHLVRLAKNSKVERIAVSTNGSAAIETYLELADWGVNDFSISLDSCCADTNHEMTGGVSVFDTIIKNISELSKITYVTVGVVLTDHNIAEVGRTIELASSLGVADIRIIPAAQDSQRLQKIHVNKGVLAKHPILAYRIANTKKKRLVRGLRFGDSGCCSLVLDDMAVWNDHHYPCIIYMREGGAPIGKVGPTMRDEREKWALVHNSFEDPICNKNCLDVFVGYNNRVCHIGERHGLLR